MRDFTLQIVSLIGLIGLIEEWATGATVFETLIVGSAACLSAFSVLLIVEKVQQRQARLAEAKVSH